MNSPRHPIRKHLRDSSPNQSRLDGRVGPIKLPNLEGSKILFSKFGAIFSKSLGQVQYRTPNHSKNPGSFPLVDD